MNATNPDFEAMRTAILASMLRRLTGSALVAYEFSGRRPGFRKRAGCEVEPCGGGVRLIRKRIDDEE